MVFGPALYWVATVPGPMTESAKTHRITELFDVYSPEFPNAPGITATELSARVQPVVLVDVRTPEEQFVSRIPGAMDHQDFEKSIADYSDSTIVAYCTIGYRSGLYTEALIERGFDAKNLEGGIVAWTHVDGPLSNQWGDTKEVHVYGRKWDLVADGYQATW